MPVAAGATKRFQNHYLECLSQQARMRHLPSAITDIRPGFVKTDLIAGSSYPLQLKPEDVAKHIVSAIENGKEVKVIDWRYDILVFLWQLIPIAGSSYPLQLKPEDVAKHIVSAIENGKEVKVIDWRYDILVFLWQLIPRWLWTRLRITT